MEDILEAIAKIERYVEGMDFKDFQADDRSIDAVIRNLEVIGEAARHMPNEICERHAAIPWGKMRGLRNVIIHEYFGVDLAILWQTVKEDLPPLVSVLRELLGAVEGA